jgi:hypothetical protein
MALFLLHETAAGYALFEAHGIDEIGQNTEAVRNSVTDMNRFGKVVKLHAFNPFTSALEGLEQINAVSEGNKSTKSHSYNQYFCFVLHEYIIYLLIQLVLVLML